MVKVKSVLKVEEELKERENECGGCGEHGSCNAVNNKCICQQGWMANSKCILSDQSAQNIGNSTLLLAQGIVPYLNYIITTLYIYIYILYIAYASVQDNDLVKGEEGMRISLAILEILAENSIYVENNTLIHELAQNSLKNLGRTKNKEHKIAEDIKRGWSKVISDLFKPIERVTTDIAKSESSASVLSLVHKLNNIILKGQTSGEKESIKTEMFEAIILKGELEM